MGKTPPISRLQNTSRHLSERKEWILNQSVECVDKGVHFRVIYQEVPNPADDTYTAFNKDAYKTGDILPNSGFLNVSVSPAQVKVDYIKSGQSDNGKSIYSYVVKSL